MILKSKILVFLIVGFSYSCSTYKSSYSDENRYYLDECFRMRNDSLKVGIDLGGNFHDTSLKRGQDFSFNNSIHKSEFKHDKKLIQKYVDLLDIKPDNFVFRASTKDILPPYYNFALYTFPNQGSIMKDSFVNIIDSLKSYTSIKYIKDKSTNNLYVLIFEQDKAASKQQNKEKKDLYKLFLKGSNWIEEHFIISDTYKDFIPANVFSESLTQMQNNDYNYYSPIAYIKEQKPFQTSTNSSKLDQWMYYQAALTFNSFVSNNNVYNQLWDDVIYSLPKSQYSLKKESFIPLIEPEENLLDSLRSRIKDKQIVIINESHWSPNHRYLGNKLLSSFYDEGFRYLSIEAVDPKDQDSLNMRKFPIQTTGLYTRDPQFANMIRNALDMGFTVVGHESDANGYNEREKQQAENVYNKTLKNNPDAKVLVWVGFGHINKNESKRPAMAYYLKKISQINPFTIEQTRGMNNSSLLKNHNLAFNLDTTSYNFSCDIFLYNNYNERNFRIKPNEENYKYAIKLSNDVKTKLKQHKVLFLMVYNENEFADYEFKAIPLINREINNSNNFQIYLPQGVYRIVYRSPTSAIIEQKSITIMKNK